MKQVLIILFSLFIGQVSYGQSDSVYLSIDGKLVSEIQIITPINEKGIRENYTYFKHQYWLGVIDTISMTILDSNESVNSKKRKIEYFKYAACDSIINKIRNSSEHWKMFSEINEIARLEIGYNNLAFNKIKYSESLHIENFSKKCQNEYKKDITTIKNKLLKEITRIKAEKYDRYMLLRTSPLSIDSAAINSFIETFDQCETDLRTLELIISTNPNDFVTTIDRLSDADFFTFTLKLSDFPGDTNTLQMKEKLKESEKSSKRKKQVLKKIKKTKV